MPSPSAFRGFYAMRRWETLILSAAPTGGTAAQNESYLLNIIRFVVIGINTINALYDQTKDNIFWFPSFVYRIKVHKHTPNICMQENAICSA